MQSLWVLPDGLWTGRRAARLASRRVQARLLRIGFHCGLDTLVPTRRRVRICILFRGCNLADRGFACFLDSKDAPAGLPLKEHIRAALKRSSVLIVVGTAGAVGSPYVEEEIREFLSGRKRPIIPIDVDGHFANCAATDGPWHVLRRERDHIWLDVDAAEFESGRPRAKTLEGITRQFRHTKNNTKRRRLLMGVGALLLILTTAAVWLAITAILARDRAEANGREARLQANRAQAALRESEQNRQRAERESSRAETQRQVAEQRQAEAQHQAELALARLLVVLSETKANPG